MGGENVENVFWLNFVFEPKKKEEKNRLFVWIFFFEIIFFDFIF